MVFAVRGDMASDSLISAMSLAKVCAGRLGGLVVRSLKCTARVDVGEGVCSAVSMTSGSRGTATIVVASSYELLLGVLRPEWELLDMS